MSGSSFQFNGQSQQRRMLKADETVKVKDEPEPEFSKLYDGDDSEPVLNSQQTKPTGSRLMDFGSLGAITSPTVSFTVPSSSSSSALQSASNTTNGVSRPEAGGTASNPRKKIKLVSETRYSRIAEMPGRASAFNFPKSGVTEHHVKRQKEGIAPKPLFSSTQFKPRKPAPSTVSVGKSFENVKDFGDWMKGELTPENYRNVMGEFKGYREKKDIMVVLEFGKKIFPKVEEYKSYMNGLRLVSTEGDRSIISDMMSSYDDLEGS